MERKVSARASWHVSAVAWYFSVTCVDATQPAAWRVELKPTLQDADRRSGLLLLLLFLLRLMAGCRPVTDHGDSLLRQTVLRLVRSLHWQNAEVLAGTEIPGGWGTGNNTSLPMLVLLTYTCVFTSKCMSLPIPACLVLSVMVPKTSFSSGK